MDTPKKRDTRDRSAYKREYRLKNLEVLKERHRAWREANPEKHYANTRKWLEKNPEWVREYHRKWRAANKEKSLEITRRHYANNTEARRESRRRHGHRKIGIANPPRPRPLNCELCGSTCKRALCLDHDHETGAFRGWICGKCNRSIGQLGDNIAGLKRALAYLEKAQHEAELRLAHDP